MNISDKKHLKVLNDSIIIRNVSVGKITVSVRRRRSPPAQDNSNARYQCGLFYTEMDEK